MSWWAFKPQIKYSTTFDIKLCSGRQCYRWLVVQFLVANVNVSDDGQPYVNNVYKLSNDNVWNGKYEHRVFYPKLVVSPSSSAGEFSFSEGFPVLFSTHPAFYQSRLNILKVWSIFH